MKILMDMDYLVVTRIKIFLQIKNLGTIKNIKMFLRIKKIHGQTGIRSQIGSEASDVRDKQFLLGWKYPERTNSVINV